MTAYSVSALRRWCWRISIFLTIGTVLIAATPATARRTNEMYRMQARAHGAASGVTQAQMRTVALELIEKRGWAAHVRTAGVVEADASWSRNKHRFTVALVFDDTNFVIRYVSSYNLGYTDTACRPRPPDITPLGMVRDRDRMLVPRKERCKAEIIHPSYNDFVRQFEHDIAKAFPLIAPAPESPPPSGGVAASIDEENRYLENLYAEGVLTQDELRAQQRLLGLSGEAVGGVVVQ